MENYSANETLKTIYQRRSIRQFQDITVEDSLIQAVLDAANQAPSAHNQQSWRFIIIRDQKKDQLARLVSQKASSFPKASSLILTRAARSIGSAPVVVAVVNTGTLISRGAELFQIEQDVSRDFFRTMEIQSSSAAVENILIAATSLGLGSVWLGILFLIKDDVLSFLGEAQGEFMAVIPLGYPQREHNSPKKRALKYVLRYL